MYSANAVEVHRLHKNYRSMVAIHDISFEVRRGETLALLGPNGAGKSTTMEILEGHRDRSGGDVNVLGVDPRHATLTWKERIGIVLQSSEESANVNTRELLAHVAHFFPRPKKVDDVLDAVGLVAKAKTRVSRLSGGQRRRLDVALGIIGRPELLFLDEPTTGFDPESRQQFWALIRSLQDEGTTILLTTHYLDEAAELSDRVAIVNGGRLVDIGTPAELGGDYARRARISWQDSTGPHDAVSHHPAAFVEHLLAMIGAHRLSALTVTTPSLEEIYLELVGAGSTPTVAGVSA